jgi:hypothetical protein
LFSQLSKNAIHLQSEPIVSGVGSETAFSGFLWDDVDNLSVAVTFLSAPGSNRRIEVKE